MIRLIVGLGNPGSEYDDTRHNAGFWWVDAAARKLGTTLQRDRAYHALVARINRSQVDSAAPSNLTPAGGGTGAARPRGRSEEPLWLLEPQTYMNLSGKSVAALARFFKIAPEEILVVHDELDLLPGQAKLKQGGGAAGHNGLKDLLAQLGSPDFWRLRIGVGHPGVKSEVVDWVLRKPSPEHREAIQHCIARTLEALPLLIDGSMERAMMKIHTKPAAKPAATEP